MAAKMQDGQPFIAGCAMKRKSISREVMQGHQQIVVKWMRRQLSRLQWKPERWAREADLAPTTVTRAMAETYQSVSSVPTLHALARAAGVPSILDFLDRQANCQIRFPVLSAMLQELLPAVGCHVGDDMIEKLAAALAVSIAGLSAQPGDEGSNPEVARALARAARAQIYKDE
jgi:hypothetical protein